MMKKIATLIAPTGWKVLSDHEQKAFVEKTFGEDQENLIAVALPNKGDGSVFAQLLLQETGYIEDKTPINAQVIQQNIINEINILNSENDTDVSDQAHWKGFILRPKYDFKTHCAEYGIELTFGRERAINLYQICLLRNGALVLTLVGQPKDHLSLKGWQIKPQENLSYEKFDPAKDHRAEGNLNNLLSMNQII